MVICMCGDVSLNGARLMGLRNPHYGNMHEVRRAQAHALYCKHTQSTFAFVRECVRCRCSSVMSPCSEAIQWLSDQTHTHTMLILFKDIKGQGRAYFSVFVFRLAK